MDIGDGPTLPQPATSLVGRERLVDSVVAHMRRDDVRLLTVTGPGGVGKTRLAIAVAHRVAPEFRDGARFVNLAPLVDHALVPSAIAQALGVRESGDSPAAERLAAFVRDRSLLLILDNFEHVLDAAMVIQRLLEASPALKVLATSRTPLRLSGEQVWPTPPLGLADESEAVGAAEFAGSDAVRLFVQRAQARDPTLAPSHDEMRTIATICRRLDGLPLAIELAAARTPLLPPEAMLARLERRLPLLAEGPRDAPGRQQTMRAAIAWSHDLLCPELRVFFRRLAVFVGGFTLDAAGAMTGSPGRRGALESVSLLADQSLLRRVPQATGEPRFALLETVREFGLELLESANETQAAGERHAAYYLALAEDRAPDLPVPGDQRWIERVTPELDNFRTAIAWFAGRGEGESLLRLSAALYELWFVRGLYAEGRQWLRRALTAGPGADSLFRAMALQAAGVLATFQGDYGEAAVWYEQELAVAYRLDEPYAIAEALVGIGHLAYRRGEYDAADTHTAEAYSLLRGRAAGVPAAAPLAALALGNRGYIAAGRGDAAAAASHFEAAIDELRATGYVWGLCEALVGLGEVRIRQGRFGSAAALFAESLEIAWASAEPLQLANSLRGVATVAASRGEAEGGASLLGASERLAGSMGAPEGPATNPIRETCLVLLTAAMGSETLRRIRSAGGSMPTVAAVAEARAILGRIGSAAAETPKHPLTARERDVLRLLVAGKSDRQIAEALFVGRRTVTTHTSSIFAKLGVSSRTEAATMAVREGLV